MSENVKVSDISAYLDAEIPPDMSEDYDNVGLLVGLTDKAVSKVLIALDITDEVIAEACIRKAQLIVSHHPLFFSLKSIRDNDVSGRKIIKLIENGISTICMHTNLDAVSWGVNNALANRLGLVDIKLLVQEGKDKKGNPYGIPKMGTLEMPVEMREFLERVKLSLNSFGLRYHDAGKEVRQVAVCGGSGGSFLDEVISKGCDTFVTADIKYDVFLRARELGINLIDGDHFATENVVCKVLKDKIIDKFPDLDVFVSSVHGQTARFYLD